MKVIFLDVDGVFTSVRTGWYNWDIHTVRFFRWLCRVSQCKLVISSTWRKNHDKAFFETILGPNLHDDWTTPVLKRGQGNVMRGHEIQDWLDRNQPEQYVIVDDDVDMLEHQKPRQVITSGYDGTLYGHTDYIKDLLGVTDLMKEDEPFHIHMNMFKHSKLHLAFGIEGTTVNAN